MVTANLFRTDGQAIKSIPYYIGAYEGQNIGHLQAQNHIDMTNLFAPLLDINNEVKLGREIEDIIEELDIMLYIANIHADTAKSFIHQVDHILNPGGEMPRCRRGNRRKAENQESPHEKDYFSFSIEAIECQDRINSRIKELEALRKQAKNVAEDVRFP